MMVYSRASVDDGIQQGYIVLTTGVVFSEVQLICMVGMIPHNCISQLAMFDDEIMQL